MSEIRRVLFPTQLDGDQRAFQHALKLSLQASAWLHVVNVHDAERAAHWSDLPTVRNTLTRWGVLPEDADLTDYQRLGLRVYLEDQAGNTAQAGDELALVALKDHPDLLVMSTRGRKGLERVRQGSVASRLSAQSAAPALLFGPKSEGFVDADTGEGRLARVVVAVDHTPAAQAALDEAIRLVNLLGGGPTTFHLLHVGGADEFPPLDLPARPDFAWLPRAVKGPVVQRIQEVAAAVDADLLVMATRGHDSLGDVLFGNTTEQVVAGSTSPVLAVPVR